MNIVRVRTRSRCEMVEVTEEVARLVRGSGVREGELVLGTWQGVHLCEWDRPWERKLAVQVVRAAV